jgi:hypothetical protein
MAFLANRIFKMFETNRIMTQSTRIYIIHIFTAHAISARYAIPDFTDMTFYEIIKSLGPNRTGGWSIDLSLGPTWITCDISSSAFIT